MKLNPDIKIPRSYSLSTLMLTTTVIVLSLVLVSDRLEISKVNRLNQELHRELGHLVISDTSQIRIRYLHRYSVNGFAFRIFAPSGKRFALNIGEGRNDSETGHPPLFARLEFTGSGKQGIIEFDFDETKFNWDWDVFSEIQETSGEKDNDRARFRWVEHSIEHYESGNTRPVGNQDYTQRFDFPDPIILVDISQFDNFGRALAPPVGVDSSNVRTFMIWLEPIAENSVAPTEMPDRSSQ